MLVSSDRLGSDVCQEEENSMCEPTAGRCACVGKASWCVRSRPRWEEEGRPGRNTFRESEALLAGTINSLFFFWVVFFSELKKVIQQAEHKGSTYCSNGYAFP